MFRYLWQLFEPQQVIYLNFEKFGYLHKGFERGLTYIGTPLADGCWVFAQLLGQPLVGFPFVN